MFILIAQTQTKLKKPQFGHVQRMTQQRQLFDEEAATDLVN
jgi:hypothetical protein